MTLGAGQISTANLPWNGRGVTRAKSRFQTGYIGPDDKEVYLMAKDGTNRGGARVGAGAKKKPLADKIAEGNPGKRTLTVIDFDNKAVDLEGQQMP